MADVVIRGIEVPKGDLEYVSLWVYGDGRVYVSNNASAASSQRVQDLAIPLPEGHGRLIDADRLAKRLKDFVDWCRDDRREGAFFVMDCPLPDSPTIVPAEGGGEDG
jgi:hypothetical protein